MIDPESEGGRQGGSFGFQITAIDAKQTPSTDDDLFRIKIWDKDNGDALVYDNQLGADDDADLTTAIATGNINIHSGGNGNTRLADAGEVAQVAEAALSQEVPEEFALKPNYPNPFNPATTIGFDLPESRTVRLEVYDVMGRRIDTLINGAMAAGWHEVQWDARSLPSGTYFYRITASDFTQVRQMLLVK